MPGVMRSVFVGRVDVALSGPDGTDDITVSALPQLLIGHQVAPVCLPAAVRNIGENNAMEPRASEPIRNEVFSWSGFRHRRLYSIFDALISVSTDQSSRSLIRLRLHFHH